MCFGGIGVVRELVNKIGLVREINDRLEDLNRLRNDFPYMDALDAKMIPSPTAAGDFMRRFTAAEVLKLMEAFNAVRPRLRGGRGRASLARWHIWTSMEPSLRRRERRRPAQRCPTRGSRDTTR